MAHSRLEKIGTIFTRISGLIRTGAMKLDETPLWYGIYKVFPPEQEPNFARPIPETEIRPIFYPEDVVRAKFYKNISNVRTINLLDNQSLTQCQKFIDLCVETQKNESLTLEQTFDSALEQFKINLYENSSKVANQEEFGKEEKSPSYFKFPKVKEIFQDT